MSIAATSEEKQVEDFEDSPKGRMARWVMEFAAARKALDAWHEKGGKALEAFKDEVKEGNEANTSRLCLFTANTQTMRALLFGKTPQVDVARRFADAQDNMARVAGLIMERALNSDIESPRDGYTQALEHALDDRLVPGGGNVRLRYEREEGEAEKVPPILDEATGEVKAPGYTKPPAVLREDVCVDYVHWKDQLWSPCKTFEDVTWWAYRAQMGKRKLRQRFGEEKAKNIPLNSKDEKQEGQPELPWARADVWEVWDKEAREVVWLVEGMDEVLEVKEDTLELEGFFPMPRPMFANTTTDNYVPRPDYKFAQDLYKEVDDYSRRIKGLQECVKVAGVYDQSCKGVQEMLSSPGNQLIPVPNWAMFAEKGAVAGAISWLPLDQVVAALDKLRELRTETIGLLYQVTGMSDIMRGQASTATTATEQAIKAKFASVRVQALQDEFARFASDIQRLKAEIMAKRFEAATLLQRSNIMQTADAQLAQQAVALLKQDIAQYRIVVKPEAVNLTDYAQMKSERVEFLQAVAGFLTAAAPVAQAVPGSVVDLLLPLLEWSVAGFRGAASIEGVVAQATAKARAQAEAAAQRPQQPPPPDPKLQAQQLKGQQELQKGQQDFQHGLMHLQAEVQADNQKQANAAKWSVLENAARERQKVVAGVDAVTHPAGVEGGR